MEPKPYFLDYAGVSSLTGIEVAVLQKYQSEARRREREGNPKPGDMPPPDERFSGSPVWKVQTIRAWQKNRPGRGVGGGRPKKG
jgi:hypothetical protein